MITADRLIRSDSPPRAMSQNGHCQPSGAWRTDIRRSCPGPLRAWFRAVQHRKGKKIARVALARRLAEIVYHVWKDHGEYWTVLRRDVVRG